MWTWSSSPSIPSSSHHLFFPEFWDAWWYIWVAWPFLVPCFICDRLCVGCMSLEFLQAISSHTSIPVFCLEWQSGLWGQGQWGSKDLRHLCAHVQTHVLVLASKGHWDSKSPALQVLGEIPRMIILCTFLSRPYLSWTSLNFAKLIIIHLSIACLP
jgi:hypothetical protein